MMAARSAHPGDPPGLDPLDGLVVAGITADSRRVEPGFLFAALPGTRIDGSRFIADAIAAGATAVLAAEGTVLPREVDASRVHLVTDPNPRRRFALMAAAFYGAQPETVVAVTGTSGKTSTVTFTRQIWSRLGDKAASLGTLGITAPGIDIYGQLTTPDPVDLHAKLADLAAAGVTRLAMEASSHGLDQYRLDGVRLSAAGFTNFGRDHLDYHATVEDYLKAKTRLLGEVLPAGMTAVLNADIPEYERLRSAALSAGRKVLAYGRAGDRIRLTRLDPLPHGLAIAFSLDGTRHELELPLIGAFQAWNVLCALALVVATGGNPGRAVDALRHLEGVRGRMELAARHPNGAPIFVDYSHKPDALAAVLGALRAHTRGRLIALFGCGGDRDRGKRPLMGEIAARLADHVIVTDDNPRSEDPAAIRREILAGCPAAAEIGDRAEAIRTAVAELGPDDLLVIAGKGHETGQIVGATVRPFDDAEEAGRAVAALAGAGAR